MIVEFTQENFNKLVETVDSLSISIKVSFCFNILFLVLIGVLFLLYLYDLFKEE